MNAVACFILAEYSYALFVTHDFNNPNNTEI